MSEPKGGPTVTVIMNCLNGERFLAEAVESVQAQSMTDLELLFWDNGSTDRSLDIIASYAAQDARICIHRNPGPVVPLGAARAHATSLATGELLAFLDVDDVLLPNGLAQLAEAFEGDDSIAGVYGGVVQIDELGGETGREVPPARRGDLLPDLLRQFDVWVASMMFRRSALVEEDLSFDPAIHASEEYCLWLQLAARRPIASIPVVTANYRVHGGSLTGTAIDRWAFERRYTLERVRAARPQVAAEFPRAWAEANARGDLYEARHLMAMGRGGEARSVLARIRGQDRRYFVLWVVAHLPAPLWRLMFRLRSGRPEPKAVSGAPRDGMHA
jgi:GT2 family glycosyltransferase